MPSVEVSLPDKLESELTRLVEQGEFINRDQAVEELLSTGIAAYDTAESTPEDAYEDPFTETAAEQQDPAALDDTGDDDYAF